MFFREWFIVFFVACFISVTFLAQSFSSKTTHLEPCLPLSAPKIEVLISGAVINPGLYEVEIGTTLKSILEMAQPAKNADKSGLCLQKKMLGSCSLIVPEKKYKKSKKKKTGSSSMVAISCADENV